MISPSRLRVVLDGTEKTIDSNYFFKTHVHLEGYVKRVMLIGLRLRGVQYENSIKIVDSTYITTANLIEKVLWLVDKKGRGQNVVLDDLKSRYADFFSLKDTVLKFSAIYRNRLAHGTIAELKDQEMIDTLCHVNKSFFQSFEQLLIAEHGNSALDKPADWGAKRGTPEAPELTVKRLKLGSLVKSPMTLSDVKAKLATTVYAKP
ncbi:hypothetical protein GCM10027342_53680 [Photobacterium alginatilyticum]